ncbi:MAG: GAF domain-containing sensor histidine kinase [Myxococcales bacterium]|nr:GAF domain-containing sensor histidine kinase [Myxococcales bacterium]
MGTRSRQRNFDMSQTGEFFERMFERSPRLGQVLSIANLLSAPLSSDELLELLMGGLSELLDAERSTLFLLSDDGDHLWSQVVQGNEVINIQVNLGEGLAGWVAKTGRPVNIKDVYQDPRFDATWDKRNGFRTGSMLCQPLKNRDGNIIGVAQSINKRGGYFTVDDEMMMRTIMAMAAISVVNGQLYRSLLSRNFELRQTQEHLQEKLREIDLLYAIERRVALETDVEGAIATLLMAMRTAVPCAVLQVSLKAEDGAMLVHRVRTEGATVEVLRFERWLGFAGRTMRAGRVLDVAELKANHQLVLCEEEGLGVEPDHGLCVPLIAQEEVLGALCLFERVSHGGGFDEHDRKLIELVSGQTAAIVARLQAREKAEREDRLAALGGALSGILHDFKTPMTIASGYAQMMARTEDADKRAEMANVVLKQLSRVTEMSKDVLGFARGTQDLFVQNVHLNDFAEEARELVAQIFQTTPAVTASVVAHYRGSARFDKLKAMRVVQNLARNSRDALMDPALAARPELSFTLVIDREDEELVLTFVDTGPGVSPEFRHRMFEAFATQGKKDGTGLGLAMVKRFAQAHGGDVQYVDTPGGGATFEVRIAITTLTPSHALAVNP